MSFTFECERCGRCCRPGWMGDIQSIVVRPFDEFRIAGSWGISVNELREKYQICGSRIDTTHAACTFLNQRTNSCTVHDCKPLACASWPYIGLTQTRRGLEKAAGICPGITITGSNENGN